MSNLLFHFTHAPENPIKVEKGVYGIEMTLDSAYSVLMQILHEGRLLGTYELFNGYNDEIPASSLSDGIYLLLITDGNKRDTFKVLKN